MRIRKSIMVLLSLLSIVGVSACSKNSKTTTEKATTTKNITTEHVHTPKKVPAIPATCFGTGISEWEKCSVCGDLLSSPPKELAMIPHTVVIEPAIEPTCSSKGLTEGSYCSVCGKTLSIGDLIDKVDHQYSEEWTIDKEATCITDGSKSHHCIFDGCNAKKDDTVITKTGDHQYSEEWTIDKEAACITDGSKSHHCTTEGCDAKKDDTVITKTGEHQYSEEWTIDKEATCKTDGSKSHHCTTDGCDAKKDVTVISKSTVSHKYYSRFCTVCGVEECTPGLTFSVQKDLTLAVSGYTGTSPIVYIPQAYNGTNITAVKAGAFKNNTDLVYVISSKNSLITSIGEEAFYGCKNLKSVTFYHIEYIDDYAFYGCENMSEFNLLVLAKSVGLNVLTGNKSLTSLALSFSAFGEGNGYLGYLFGATRSQDNAKFVPASLTRVSVYDEVVPRSAFSYCKITEVVLGSEVKTIETFAFIYCDKLTKIDFGKGVTTISESSFAYCTSLTEISLPSSIEWIRDLAFSDCTNLENIYLSAPKTTLNICGLAFVRCSNLKNVYFDGTLTEYNSKVIVDDNNANWFNARKFVN